MKLEYVAQILRGWPKQGARERTEIVTSGASLINGDWVEMQANGTANKTSSASTRRAGLVIRGNGDSSSAANASGQLMTPQAAKSITALSWAGGFLTVSVASHGYAVGNSVTIAGTVTNVNTTVVIPGTYTVSSVPTTGTFTVSLPSDPGVITLGTNTATLVSGFSAPGEALTLWGNFIVATSSYETTGYFAGDVYAPGTPLTVRSGKLAQANGAASGAVTNTSLTWAAGVVTVVTATAHGFATGQSVTIAGVTNAGYNGTFTITVVDATTFTYVLAADPGAQGVAPGTSTSVKDPEIGFVLRSQGATTTETAHLVAVIY